MVNNRQVSSIEIQAEHIRMMFRVLPIPTALTLIISPVLVSMLWNTASHRALLVWLSLAYGSLISRLFFLRAYQRRQRTPEATCRWGIASAIQSAIGGLIWGAAPFLFLDPTQPVSLITLTVVLIAMMGGTMAFYSMYQPAYMSFMTPVAVSLIVVLVMRAGSVGMSMASLVIMAASGYLLIGKLLHRALDDSLRIRFENLALRQKAEEQSTLLKTTLESMDQGICLVDRDDHLRLWNFHFLELLGLRSMRLDDPPDLRQLLQATNPPLGLNSGQTQYRRADGAIIEIRQRPMPDGGRVLTYTDISLIAERTEALAVANRELNQRHHQLEVTYQQLAHTQEQLIQSAKMASLGLLVAGVAHELNNPISFVHGNLEFIGEYTDRLATVIDAYRGVGQGDPPSRRAGDRQKEKVRVGSTLKTLRELIVSCREGTERVKNIVLDLRTFSRTDETGPVLADLHEGLESTLNLLAEPYKDRITVHRNYGDLPQVECYPGQINQVFMNLLLNAAQAIPETGDVWIRTAREDDRVAITIRDNGNGIPEPNLHRIFDPFFTTKPVGTGTGLGLSITYSIIEKHGGTIRVKSQVNVGTVFTVELPLHLNRGQSQHP